MVDTYDIVSFSWKEDFPFVFFAKNIELGIEIKRLLPRCVECVLNLNCAVTLVFIVLEKFLEILHLNFLLQELFYLSVLNSEHNYTYSGI